MKKLRLRLAAKANRETGQFTQLMLVVVKSHTYVLGCKNTDFLSGLKKH